jgi:hypothetical protein
MVAMYEPNISFPLAKVDLATATVNNLQSAVSQLIIPHAFYHESDNDALLSALTPTLVIGFSPKTTVPLPAL